MMPWLVTQFVEMVLGAGLFLVYAVAGAKYSFLEITLYIFSLMVTSYFIYSVLSHYVLMRRMSKTSAQVISSVMEGEELASNFWSSRVAVFTRNSGENCTLQSSLFA